MLRSLFCVVVARYDDDSGYMYMLEPFKGPRATSDQTLKFFGGFLYVF